MAALEWLFRLIIGIVLIKVVNSDGENMLLKQRTEQALDKWLKIGLWYTSDDWDMNRFYDFVDQYQKDHGFSIDEAALKEIIERKIVSKIHEQSEIIHEYISDAIRILDFLKHTGRS